MKKENELSPIKVARLANREFPLGVEFVPNPSTRIIEKNGRTIIQGKNVSITVPKDREFIFALNKEGKYYLKNVNVTMYDGDKIRDYNNLNYPGIINKQITGIGATTNELLGERNSIIVVPTKSLAFTKHKQFPDSLYVGSSIENCITSPTDEEIAEYIKRTDIYKKILVVADSLPRVLNKIGEEHYNEYFYLIDEIDTIQMDSYFRPKLEDTMDYYFEFSRENRAMVSATMKAFSHPGLEEETVTTYGYETMPHKNCSLVYTDNPDLALKEHIEFLYRTTRGKIVVAYNSPSRILRIIRSLRKTMRDQCTVLCSEINKKEMTHYCKRSGKEEVYYHELTDTSLKSRITFITSAYFVGLDITDPFHLVSAANAGKPYTLLSLEKMIQIAGRCRLSQGILSDTLIYSARKAKKVDINEYAILIHKTADKLLEFIRMGDEHFAKYLDMASIKSILQKFAQEKLPGEPNYIPLIRQNIHGNYQKSYNNIDALIERQILVNELYSSPEQLKEYLEAAPNVSITYSKKMYGDKSLLSIASAAEVEESKEWLDQKELVETVIPALIAGEKINVKDLTRKRSRQFVEAYWELIQYVHQKELIEKLTEESKDPRRLRNYRNAVKFRALANNHPFKAAIFSAFKKGEIYTRKEIHTKLCDCFRSNGLRPPGNARESVQLLSTFFMHKRPDSRKDQYCISGKYSYRISYANSCKKIIKSKKPLSEVFDF